MIHTKITELLGIKYPILMGAMAWITNAKLVAAVSNAGGAGVLGSGGRDDIWVREQIRETKKRTDKPFGINVSLATTPMRERIVEAIIQEQVPFVTLGAGDPRPYIGRFREAGIRVVCIVPNTKAAKRVEISGADMIVIEGMESGGRIGTLSTMSLLSNVIPEVNLPVAAAGGIVDGRGLAAALVMGADGIQMGSRFLLSSECESHPSNALAIMNATDIDSCAIGWSRGKGLRGLRNTFAEKYLEMETTGVPTDILGKYVKGCSRRVAEHGTGEFGENGIVQVGESLLPLKQIQPAAEIILEVMTEAEYILRNAGHLVRA